MSTSPETPAPVDGAEATPRWKTAARERLGKVQAWREENETKETVVSFTAGFLFDVVTLSRIDDKLTMLQHLAYLVLLGSLMMVSERYTRVATQVPRWLEPVMPFLSTAIHFFLGSLLSSFALFFFKSAGGLAGLGFTATMFALLVANELPRFRSLGPVIRWGLYALCVACYFSYVLPVLLGFLSGWLVLLAVILATGVMGALIALLRRWGVPRVAWLARVAFPTVCVQVFLLVAYLTHLTPPVPLNVQYMGVYHDVRKDGGEYHLQHQRPRWKFWHHGDQDFHARPGDRIHVFAEVFAPRSFRDRINIRFSHYDEKRGWQSSDVIPLTVTGGREKGFRGHANKQNFKPGEWEVQVETADGRPIGYVRFDVIPDEGTDERQWYVDVR